MNNLLKNWNVVRVIRLMIAVIIAIYSYVSKDYIFLWLAGFFFLQSILNLSCCACGTSSCSSEADNKKKGIYKDIVKPYSIDNKK